MTTGEHETAPDLLGAYWDALLAGRSDRDSTAAFDPALADTVRRIRRLDDARPPDPDFVARLERRLMEAARNPNRGLPGPSDAGRIAPVWPVGSAGGPLAPPRSEQRARYHAPFASGVLVLIVLAASVVVFGDRRGSGERPAAVAPSTAAEATGTPSPAECRVAPSAPQSILPPDGGPLADEQAEEAPVPPGRPANAETVAAVEAVVWEWIACGNAGDGRRWAALFSDRYLTHLAVWGTSFTLDDRPPTDLAEFLERAPAPLPIEAWRPMPLVQDVRMLPDGRVAATIVQDHDPEGEAVVFLFARSADRFLIDGARPVVSQGTPTFVQAGLEATIGSSEVRLREAPSGRSREVERLARGATVRVTGDAVEADGAVWWPVENLANGLSGYVVSTYLVPAPLPATPGVEQAETVLRITVDGEAVDGGDPTALASARAEIDRALAPYDRCRVAVARVLGPEEMPPVGLAGTRLADVIAEELNRSFPDLFRGTAFQTLVDDQTPPDRIDLRLWFFTGCAATEATPTTE